MMGPMRPVIITANWKMNTSPADAGPLARSIADATEVAGVTRIICPPYVALAAVGDALAGTGRGRRRPERARRIQGCLHR